MEIDEETKQMEIDKDNSLKLDVGEFYNICYVFNTSPEISGFQRDALKQACEQELPKQRPCFVLTEEEPEKYDLVNSFGNKLVSLDELAKAFEGHTFVMVDLVFADTNKKEITVLSPKSVETKQALYDQEMEEYKKEMNRYQEDMALYQSANQAKEQFIESIEQEIAKSLEHQQDDPVGLEEFVKQQWLEAQREAYAKKKSFKAFLKKYEDTHPNLEDYSTYREEYARWENRYEERLQDQKKQAGEKWEPLRLSDDKEKKLETRWRKLQHKQLKQEASFPDFTKPVFKFREKGPPQKPESNVHLDLLISHAKEVAKQSSNFVLEDAEDSKFATSLLEKGLYSVFLKIEANEQTLGQCLRNIDGILRRLWISCNAPPYYYVKAGDEVPIWLRCSRKGSDGYEIHDLNNTSISPRFPESYFAYFEEFLRRTEKVLYTSAVANNKIRVAYMDKEYTLDLDKPYDLAIPTKDPVFRITNNYKLLDVDDVTYYHPDNTFILILFSPDNMNQEEKKINDVQFLPEKILMEEGPLVVFLEGEYVVKDLNQEPKVVTREVDVPEGLQKKMMDLLRVDHLVSSMSPENIRYLTNQPKITRLFGLSSSLRFLSSPFGIELQRPLKKCIDDMDPVQVSELFRACDYLMLEADQFAICHSLLSPIARMDFVSVSRDLARYLEKTLQPSPHLILSSQFDPFPRKAHRRRGKQWQIGLANQRPKLFLQVFQACQKFGLSWVAQYLDESQEPEIIVDRIRAAEVSDKPTPNEVFESEWTNVLLTDEGNVAIATVQKLIEIFNITSPVYQARADFEISYYSVEYLYLLFVDGDSYLVLFREDQDEVIFPRNELYHDMFVNEDLHFLKADWGSTRQTLWELLTEFKDTSHPELMEFYILVKSRLDVTLEKERLMMEITDEDTIERIYLQIMEIISAQWARRLNSSQLIVIQPSFGDPERLMTAAKPGLYADSAQNVFKRLLISDAVDSGLEEFKMNLTNEEEMDLVRSFANDEDVRQLFLLPLLENKDIILKCGICQRELNFPGLLEKCNDFPYPHMTGNFIVEQHNKSADSSAPNFLITYSPQTTVPKNYTILAALVKSSLYSTCDAYIHSPPTQSLPDRYARIRSANYLPTLVREADFLKVISESESAIILYTAGPLYNYDTNSLLYGYDPESPHLNLLADSYLLEEEKGDYRKLTNFPEPPKERITFIHDMWKSIASMPEIQYTQTKLLALLYFSSRLDTAISDVPAEYQRIVAFLKHSDYRALEIMFHMISGGNLGNFKSHVFYYFALQQFYANKRADHFLDDTNPRYCIVFEDHPQLAQFFHFFSNSFRDNERYLITSLSGTQDKNIQKDMTGRILVSVRFLQTKRQENLMGKIVYNPMLSKNGKEICLYIAAIIGHLNQKTEEELLKKGVFVWMKKGQKVVFDESLTEVFIKWMRYLILHQRLAHKQS